MDHLIAGAQDHIHYQDNNSSAYEFDFKCDNCKDGFDKGHGVKITDEKFCNNCYKGYKHFDFYRNHCGLIDRQIYEITQFTVLL